MQLLAHKEWSEDVLKKMSWIHEVFLESRVNA